MGGTKGPWHGYIWSAAGNWPQYQVVLNRSDSGLGMFGWCAAILIVLSLPGSLRAEHFSGVSLTYTCDGGGFYTVALELYLDCAGAPNINQTLNFSNDCGLAFSLQNLAPTSVEEISPVCPAQAGNTTCNGGPFPGFRLYRFEATVFLSPCDSWNINWYVCCRNTMVNLALVPGIYVETTLNNANGDCDSSPVFADSGVPHVCVGEPVLYNPGASDPDGNAMSFALIDARFATPEPFPVNYAPGYTGTEPVPGITIDPSTGQLSFTPLISGNYVVVIEVTTYDSDGNVLGTVMRDLMFVVFPCDGSPPFTEGLSNAVNSVILSPFVLEVCDGANFCVDMIFTDPDITSLITVVSNATSLLPGGTFSVTGSSPATVTICGIADAANLPVNVLLSASDDTCPLINTATTSMLIVPAEPLTSIPDPGLPGTTQTCAGAPPFDLFPILNGTPAGGGWWTGPSGGSHAGMFQAGSDPFGVYTYNVGNACDFLSAAVTVTAASPDPGSDAAIQVCSDDVPFALIDALGGTPDPGGNWSGPGGAFGGVFDPSIHAQGVYTYAVPAVPPCPSATATLIVGVSAAPSAGVDAALSICATDAPVTLFDQLGAIPSPGGSWTGPDGAFAGSFDPAIHTPGIHIYTVSAVAPCADASATVSIGVIPPADAGEDVLLELCTTDPVVDLFTQLGGTPMPGGTWTGPTGTLSGSFDPGSDPAGAYTYTVNGATPCSDAAAVLTISLSTAANAGGDAVLTLCSSDMAADLFAVLGGTPDVGGVWTGPGGTISGMFDPATDVPGIHTYTVAGTAGCPDALATVDVVVNDAVDAGVDAALILCTSDAAVPLLSELGGLPDAGGTWTGPGGVFSGDFDPGVDVGGAYTYTVAGTTPCADASATVAVVVNSAADPGLGSTLTLCSTDAVLDLFQQLGGSPDVAGTWEGPGGPMAGVFDPGTDAPGQYTYTVSGTSPCSDASASITVDVNIAADAGSDVTVTYCSDHMPQDLFTELGGSPDPGGSWVGPAGSFTGVFDPAIDVPGQYTYTVPGLAPCLNASATVTVVLNTASNAGADATLELCSNDAPIQLFTHLGGFPQAGGVWTGPAGPSSGVFDPAVDPAGDYTYTVIGATPCIDASASITVVVNAEVHAGVDASVALCSDDAEVELLILLGGNPDAGGTWMGPGGAFAGLFDPAVHPPGNYIYTVDGTSPCADMSATLTLAVNSAPDAGSDATVTVCNSDAPVDLFPQLGGASDAGGSWVGPSGISDGIFEPGMDAPGAYTYQLIGAAPCTPAEAVVSVVVNMAPDAGANASLLLCDSGPPEDLFAQLAGTPDAGGTWSGPSGASNGVFDPSLDTPGTYVYTVQAMVPCAEASATFTVTVTSEPSAGQDALLSLCSSGTAEDLFAQLGNNADPGGTWNGPTGPSTGIFDPAVDPAGDYTYTIDAIGACAGDAATVTVVVIVAADAGANGNLTWCSTAPPVDLFPSLDGSPDPGGTWTGLSGASSGSYDPAVDPPGVYTYTVQGTSPCPDVSAAVTVSVTDEPNAGESTAFSLCNTSAIVDLFTQLGGTPDPGGSWTGPDGSMDGWFDPASGTPGIHTYTIPAIGPCAGDVATVTVVVEEQLDAGTSSSIALCENEAPVQLLAALGPTVDPGGSWSGPTGTVMNGVFTPGTDQPGVHTYTLTGNVCATASSTVTVGVSQVVDAGGNGSGILCSDQQPINLYSLLTGNPGSGGTWTDPSGTTISSVFDPATDDGGEFLYTLAANAGCPGDQSSVTVTVNVLPQAGMSGSLALCSNSAATSLFDALQGSSDPGGNWMGPDGLPHGPMIDPALDPAGVYMHTVTGTAPCPNSSATVTVTIATAPYAGDDGQAIFCSTDLPAALIDLLEGDPQPGGTWVGPEGLVLAGLFLPSVSSPGLYTYTVSGAVVCNSDSANVQITVSMAANAGENAAITLCSNEASVDLFTLLGAQAQGVGTWSGPDGALPGGILDPASASSGGYTYMVVAMPPCPADEATVLVEVVPVPVAQAVLVSNTGCAPAEVVLLSAFNGPADCIWTFSDGTIIEDCGPLTVLFEEPGIYDVTLTVDGANGCGVDQSTVPGLIEVGLTPTAGFSMMPEVLNTFDTEAYFPNGSTGATTYEWSINGTMVSSATDLVHGFVNALGDVYIVCLTAIAANGCADTLCVEVEVEDGLGFHVPNAFTPDNDGLNDEFLPVHAGRVPQDYLLQIFDRWGGLLFTTNDPLTGWTGRSADGGEIPTGVYIWQVGGRDAVTGRVVDARGHVTLLR